MLKLFTGALLALAIVPSAAAAANCPGLKPAADAVRAARAQLQTLPDGGGMATTVPPGGKAMIAAMKDRLALFAGAAVACRPDGDPKAILALLSAAAAPGKDETVHPYGDGVSFDVRRLGDKLVIVPAFSIECAGDSVLMVFARAGGAGWREVLRYQTRPYDEVSGGLGGARFAFSPPDRSGAWFLVVHHVLGWCSSTWSGIDYAVLRPSGDPTRPRILLEGSDPIWWGNDDMGRLAVDAGGFTLRFHAGSMDIELHNREWVRHFSVAGDAVRRAPPLADSPRDFADEWVQSDWKTIASWTANPALRPLQARLHKQRFFQYAAIRACRVAGRTQIAATDADHGDAPVFFLVEGTGPVYRMLDVGAHATRGCDGKNQFHVE